MKKFSILLFIITIFSSAGYSQAPKYFYGTASWYGEEFAGKKTASGQIFDPNALTAAHRTLPFGTLVEVESLENGNKVQVMINDRGPVTGNRIIDISKKAAQILGHVDSGTFYVKVTVIKEGTGVIENTDNSNENINENVTNNTIVEEVKENSSTNGYEEKTVEREMKDNVIDLDLKDDELDKDFITKEPDDVNVEPTNNLDQIVNIDNDKNIVDLDDPSNINTYVERNIPLDNKETVLDKGDTLINQKDNTLVVDETKVTPELLLTNDSVIKVEKGEIDKELDIEIETPFPDDIKNKQANPNFTDETSDWNNKLEQNKDAQGYSYAVQVGAFRKEANALKLYDKLLKKDFPVFTAEVYVKNKRFVRVRIGYYGSLNQAKAIQSRIQSQKLPAVIVKVKLK